MIENIATRSFAGKLARSVPLWVFLLTFIILALHPIPECVACEFPHPWGRNDISYARDSKLFEAWLILGSFLAGFWSLRRNWLVPLAMVTAYVTTQPIGGVPFWSLWWNEGPMIVLLDVPTGAASLLLGHLLRCGIGQVRGWLHARSS
jgi:hypothetical protein